MFIVQMCSFLASETCWFSDGANNSKSSSIIANVANTYMLAMGLENRKFSAKISILKFQSFLIQQISCFDFSIRLFPNKFYLIDKRKEIACIMSNSFHSSKYKSFIWHIS